ncbi:MAG: hypothetical protein U5R31_07580 [Acidimicrobiia bacterium]|nr:hypothetical protein [Acidimicrobiia bacterium]
MAKTEEIRYKHISRQISDLFNELTTVHGLARTPVHLFMRQVKEAAEEGSRSAASLNRARLPEHCLQAEVTHGEQRLKLAARIRSSHQPCGGLTEPWSSPEQGDGR